jgi:uncharacterized repeat protein (TIGR01451 family)
MSRSLIIIPMLTVASGIIVPRAIANPLPTPTQPSPLLPTRNVLNGGFEQPIQAVGAGSGVLEGYGTTPPIIWQTTEDTAPYANNLEIWNGPATGSGGPVGGARAGAQYAEVNAASNGSIYQDVCMLPGESVDWSLWHAARDSGQTNIMQVSITDPSLWTGKTPPVTQLYTSPNLSTNYSQGWQNKSGNWLSTVAAVKPLRFAFQAIQGSSGFVSLGNFIDDIALDLSPIIDFLPTETAKNINLTSTIEGNTTNNYYLSLRVNGKMQTAGNVTINLTGLNATRNFTIGSVLKGGATIAGLTATKNGTAITLSIPARTYNPNLPADYIHIPIDFSDTITQPNDNIAFTLSNPIGGGGISSGTLTVPPLSIAATNCLGTTRTIVNTALADDDVPSGGLAGISGTVFEDYGTGTTGDNIKQGTEAGISGVDVTLYLDDGDQVFEPGTGDTIAGATQASNVTGAYNFPGLPSGQFYWIKIDAATATNRIYGGLTGNQTTALPNPRLVVFNGVSLVEDFPFDAGRIGVAKIQSNVQGTKATIDFVIKNYGPVSLTNVELIDSLDQTFTAGNYTIAAAPTIQVAPTMGSTVTPATNFNGATNQNLLNSGNSQLKVSESVTIRLEVNVTNPTIGGDGSGNYLNNAIVNAKTPTGITITDASTGGTTPDQDDVTIDGTTQDTGTGLNDQDGDPTNNTSPTVVSVIGTNVGGICAAPNGLVFSGQLQNIYAVDVNSGKTKIMAGGALATVNGASTNHVGHLVYYADGNSLYAWDSINNQHITITNQFQTIAGINIPGFSLGSGGAAFYNGSLYQGVDTGTFEIYKIDFVPGSDGRVIQSIAPVGIANLVATGKLTAPNWGDFIISDTGLILANSNGGQYFWSYDLNTNTFVNLTENISANSQLAKDGQGRLWGLSNASTVFQVQVSGSTVSEVPGTNKSTGNHTSADAAECAVGLNTIGDRVWNDTNGNGIQDAGEAGIGNVTIDLYWDLNDNGKIDAGEPVLETKTTDANGAYDFNQLLFGGYVVKVSDKNNVLTKATLTTSSNTLPVLLPVGKIDYNDADFGYKLATGSPNVLLVKRITAINGTTNTINGDKLAGYIDEPTNAYDDNTITIPTQTTPTDPPKDSSNWPPLNTFMLGGINGGNIKPGDELDYSIYFLSTGDDAATNVLFCDRVPNNVTFVPTAFNGQATAPSGLGTGDRGILLNQGTTTGSLSNIGDGDIGQYLAPGISISSVYPSLGNSCGTNDNGAIVVNLGTIPKADGPGTPPNSYGFVRFRGRVK